MRREALLSSQIEGTQSSLSDLLLFELEEAPGVPFDDVVEVSSYVAGLEHGLTRLAEGFPLSCRLLREIHGRLLSRGRGADRLPGEFRRSQNWIGGTRPGNARFVPPPPWLVEDCMGLLEQFIHGGHHGEHSLPVLVRAALAHVQFETIHPFLDGNGRIGRLLITLLLEHWGVMRSPILYLSHSFKRHQREYYDRLSAVRTDGDWEGWTRFYLACVDEAAEDGVSVAQRIFALTAKDRGRLMSHTGATVAAIHLLDLLPSNPIVTVPRAAALLGATAPTARKAVEVLEEIGVLHETSGRQRDRVYAYQAYLQALTADEGRG